MNRALTSRLDVVAPRKATPLRLSFQGLPDSARVRSPSLRFPSWTARAEANVGPRRASFRWGSRLWGHRCNRPGRTERRHSW